MPFKSKAQRRACYAAHDPNWDCGEWESHTTGNLPEKVKKKKHESFTNWLENSHPEYLNEFNMWQAAKKLGQSAVVGAALMAPTFASSGYAAPPPEAAKANFPPNIKKIDNNTFTVDTNVLFSKLAGKIGPSNDERLIKQAKFEFVKALGGKADLENSKIRVIKAQQDGNKYVGTVEIKF
jgi:hypothetical protein